MCTFVWCVMCVMCVFDGLWMYCMHVCDVCVASVLPQSTSALEEIGVKANNGEQAVLRLSIMDLLSSVSGEDSSLFSGSGVSSDDVASVSG